MKYLITLLFSLIVIHIGLYVRLDKQKFDYCISSGKQYVKGNCTAVEKEIQYVTVKEIHYIQKPTNRPKVSVSPRNNTWYAD